jgi:hypothetical protein
MIDKELMDAQSRLVNQTELRAQKKNGWLAGRLLLLVLIVNAFFLFVLFTSCFSVQMEQLYIRINMGLARLAARYTFKYLTYQKLSQNCINKRI